MKCRNNNAMTHDTYPRHLRRLRQDGGVENEQHVNHTIVPKIEESISKCVSKDTSIQISTNQTKTFISYFRIDAF